MARSKLPVGCNRDEFVVVAYRYFTFSSILYSPPLPPLQSLLLLLVVCQIFFGTIVYRHQVLFSYYNTTTKTETTSDELVFSEKQSEGRGKGGADRTGQLRFSRAYVPRVPRYIPDRFADGQQYAIFVIERFNTNRG